MDNAPKIPLVQEDAWSDLKVHSNARIALGNVGGSLPLREVLNFKLAHANAKDAIYTPLDTQRLSEECDQLGLPFFQLKSKITDRTEYLKRPDLGRRLNQASVEELKKAKRTYDLVFILVDGLSANAINTHALIILNLILPQLTHFSIAICLVSEGRVAIGDEIGMLLKAKFTSVLIGERPGLSSPKSMGIYTTYTPQLGFTDERRNCISNIHENGLSYEQAIQLLNYLIEQSFLRKMSGVDLKIELDKLIR